MTGVTPTRAVLVGAGGHARVLLDIIEDMPDIRVAGFVSIGPEETLYGYPCLGGDGALPAILASGVTSAVLGIGDNRRRKLLMESLSRLGFNFVSAISRTASVSKYAWIGAGAAIMPGAVVNANAKIGEAAIVNTNATVDHDCVVSPFAHIAPGVSVAGGVRIGEGALLGIGSSILPGLSIGAWTVVGGGAAVVSNLPSGVVAAGVPARICKAIPQTST